MSLLYDGPERRKRSAPDKDSLLTDYVVPPVPAPEPGWWERFKKLFKGEGDADDSKDE